MNGCIARCKKKCNVCMFCMKGEWLKPWVVYGDVRPGEVHLRRKLAKSGLISIIA